MVRQLWSEGGRHDGGRAGPAGCCCVDARGRDEPRADRCHWLVRRYKYRQMAFTGSEQAETQGGGRQGGREASWEAPRPHLPLHRTPRRHQRTGLIILTLNPDGKSMKERRSCQKSSLKSGMDPSQSVKCKIVVVGDSQCGKTALLHVFAKDCFPEVRPCRLTSVTPINLLLLTHRAVMNKTKPLWRWMCQMGLMLQ